FSIVAISSSLSSSTTCAQPFCSKSFAICVLNLKRTTELNSVRAAQQHTKRERRTLNTQTHRARSGETGGTGSAVLAGGGGCAQPTFAPAAGCCGGACGGALSSAEFPTAQFGIDSELAADGA